MSLEDASVRKPASRSTGQWPVGLEVQKGSAATPEQHTSTILYNPKDLGCFVVEKASRKHPYPQTAKVAERNSRNTVGRPTH